MKKWRHLGTLLLLSLFLLGSIQSVSAAEPTDITNHWAQDYILNLVNNDIMETYDDGTFRPDQAITRGEFAVALARQMNIAPSNGDIKFSDIEGNPGYKLIDALVGNNVISGYPDGTFRPEQPITRAEVTVIMIRALGINDDKYTVTLDNYHPFADVSSKHWAVNQIKIAERLGLVSGDQEANFYPSRNTTRAEAARFLTRVSSFTSGTGYLTDVYPTSKKVSINLLDGTRKIYNYNADAIVGRNNRTVSVDEILDTDKVFLLADNNDEIKYMKAYGMVTQADLSTEISNMTNGLLEPQDVEQLSSGNLNILKPKITSEVEQQLEKQGLTNEEVAAIMQTNWNQLEDLSKTRLAEAIAIQTGLPLDITRSLMAGDWDKIKSYAQIELIQRLVQEVLNSDLIS